jgi:hypothetical protein
MKQNICFLLIACFSLSFISCEKTTDENESNNLQKKVLSGYVQKGPFINGTAITISELTLDLIQTGRTFSTQIYNNKGSFEFEEIELSSQFVELKADGFYFNEVSGDKSTARLVLYAFSDLNDKNSINVNILTHLEKHRVEYLISQGSSFDIAKKSAMNEILKIFSIEKPDILESELLDISQDSDDNAILLAISIIMQGLRTDAELSELLANISADIKEDGILNSAELGTELINHAQLLNLSKIRENLVERYDGLGFEASFPDFEKYIQIFMDNTDYESTIMIDYPEFSNYGENVLFAGKSNFRAQTFYSFAANLPEQTELKIILKGGMWYYETLPSGPVNWTVSQYNESEQSQIFVSSEPGKQCDLKIEFEIPYIFKNDSLGQPEIQNDTIMIEFYENMSELPTKTKMIIIEEYIN